jgi:hypothetical protein
LIFNLLIAAVVVLKLLELFKISKLKKLQKQVDTLMGIISKLNDADKKIISVQEKNFIDVTGLIRNHEKRIFELEQKLANDSRKV